MKQSWKGALAHFTFNLVVLGIIALVAWASPDRELSDYDLAYGLFIGASIYPMADAIRGSTNRRHATGDTARAARQALKEGE